MTAKKYPVVEIFGPTIQGEGALAGAPTHFIRMGGCDYACSWCDSAHAVLAEEVRKATKMQVDEIIAYLVELPGRPQWVTISGGNPLLHDLTDLMKDLKGQYQVAVETQGTLFKDWVLQVDLLTISPKPPSSGNVTSYETTKKFLQQTGIKPGTVLKCVVFDEKDYSYARAVHQNFPSIPFYLSVGTLMGGLYGDFSPPQNPGVRLPWLDGFNEGKEMYGVPIDNQESILSRYRWLAELAAADDYMGDVVVFPQLHALLWGHERGH